MEVELSRAEGMYARGREAIQVVIGTRAGARMPHPTLSGTIESVGWHYKDEKPFYTLSIDGKKRSKRYWDSDLQGDQTLRNEYHAGRDAPTTSGAGGVSWLAPKVLSHVPVGLNRMTKRRERC